LCILFTWDDHKYHSSLNTRKLGYEYVVQHVHASCLDVIVWHHLLQTAAPAVGLLASSTIVT
jgi:hypothetical protein